MGKVVHFDREARADIDDLRRRLARIEDLLEDLLAELASRPLKDDEPIREFAVIRGEGHLDMPMDYGPHCRDDLNCYDDGA